MKNFRFTLCLLCALLFAPVAFGASVITGTITITNVSNLTGGSTNAETITINADTRTWTNAVSSPSTQIKSNSTVTGSINSLLNHAATYPFTGLQLISTTASNITWRGASGGALVITLAPTNWGYATLVTNTITPAFVVRVPFSVEAATNRTNIASQLVADLRLYSTNNLGAIVYVNGASAGNANLTNTSTFIWGQAGTTNLSGYPTNLANAQVAAAAAIARSKIAAGTADHIVIHDGAGLLSSEATLGATRFPALTGDVTTAGGSLSTTIAANSVALTTDTTGNYVVDVAGTANEVTLSHTPAEGSTATVSLPAVIDLGGKTSLEVPNAAAPETTVFGQVAGDNNAWAASHGALQFYDGTTNTWLLGTITGDTPSNGQVPKWNTDGTITWEADSTGGAGSSFVNGVAVSDANITNTTTLIWGIGDSTNVFGYPTNLANAQISASAAIAKSKISTSGTWTAAEIPTLTTVADGGANTIKMKGYIVLASPHMAEGTGAVLQTTNTLSYFGQALFANAGAAATNYVEYRLTVPEDVDTAIDMKVERFKFRLSAADTGAHSYVLTQGSVADSASYDSPSLSQSVTLTFAGDASGASGDVESISGTTLTNWAGNVTAGRLWVIRLARNGDSDASTVNSYSGPLVISYGLTQ